MRILELDDDVLDDWESVKKDLKHLFRQFKGISTPIKDTTVFKCLLYCYQNEMGAIPIDFVCSFESTD
jgi:hypothetical protein